METLNLKTTLNAYPKLSPSILKDYVTRDDLNTKLEDYPTNEELTNTLDNYVEEAPVDSKPYARKDESWVPVKNSALESDRVIYFGSNQDLQLDSEAEVLALQQHATIPASDDSYVVNYNQVEDGYVWIVCTEPIKSIIWGTMGMIADYERQNAVIVSNTGANYYCYRIREKLVANQWVFLVNL